MEETAELQQLAVLSAHPEDAAAHEGHGEQVPASAAGLGPEMSACQTMEELLDVIMEEAVGMSGAHATTALTRLVHLSRVRAHRVRGAPALSALAAALHAQADELTPKVRSSVLCAMGSLLCEGQ